MSTFFLNIHIHRAKSLSKLQVPMAINRYTKHGRTCLILPWNEFHADLTICMHISPNSGPESFTPKRDNNDRDSSNRSSRSQRINIAHLNARSIKNREHYILARNLVTENNLDILTISQCFHFEILVFHISSQKYPYFE